MNQHYFATNSFIKVIDAAYKTKDPNAPELNKITFYRLATPFGQKMEREERN